MYTLVAQTDAKKNKNKWVFSMAIPKKTQAVLPMYSVCIYYTPSSINPPGGPNNSFWVDFTEK